MSGSSLPQQGKPGGAEGPSLAEALAIHEQIVAASPIGITIADHTGQCILANDAMARLVGATRQQLLAQNYNQVASWQRSGLLTSLQAALNGEGRQYRRVDVTTTYGRDVSLDCHIAAFSLGTDPYALVTVEDVTERARAEHNRQESDSRFRAITENATDYIFIKDRERRYTFVNRAMAELLATPAADIVGRTATEVFGPEQGAIIEAVDARTFDGDTVNETRPLAVGDTQSFFNTIQTPFETRGDEVVSIVGIVRDVTPQKTIERELRRHQEQLEALVAERTTELSRANEELSRELAERKRAEDERSRYADLVAQTNDLAYVLDDRGNVLYVNQAARAFTGFGPEDLIGKPFAPLFEGEQLVLAQEVYARTLGGEEGHCEIRFKETGVWCEHKALPTRDAAGRVSGAIGIGRDNTERRAMEARLRQAEKMEAIGQLAGGVAHDFNNRLVAIQGFAQLLEEEAEGARHRDYADRIVRSAERAGRLTQQMLAFARKGNYESVPVNIHSLIAEVVMFVGQSIDKRIQVEQHLEANPPMTTGDPGQLQNMLLNLAINARDAMPDGGKLVFATKVAPPGSDENTVLRLAETDRPCLHISVIDSGTGIDAETRTHIFEPFYTTKGVGAGTGMGLASVYGVVQNHGGGLAVESGPGRGSTFRIELPLAAVGADAPAGTLPDQIRGSAHILLADDEPDVRTFAQIALRKLGYRVTTCADGQEAARRYQEGWREIDLVVLDMVMPKMNGSDVFRAMAAINPAVRVLLASGYSLAGPAEEVLAAGACGFIQKPYDARGLSAKVAQALQQDIPSS